MTDMAQTTTTEILTDEDLAALEDMTFTPEIEPEDFRQDVTEAQAADQTPAPAAADADVAFTDLLDAVTETQVDTLKTALVASFAERARYELEKNPHGDKTQENVAAAQKHLMLPTVLRGLVVTGVKPDFMNDPASATKRRNVYTPAKMKDILMSAKTGVLENAVNIATIVTLFRFREQKIPFTKAVAKACVSDKIAVEPFMKPFMRRHTVSESTADAQAGSTMMALELLGVVKQVGTKRAQVFELVESALTRRLEEIVKMAHRAIA